MRMLKLLFLILPIVGWSQNHIAMNERTILLGDSTIVLKHYNRNSYHDILFLNIHEDEYTSIEVVEEFSKSTPTNFAYLYHNQTRLEQLPKSTHKFECPIRPLTTQRC